MCCLFGLLDYKHHLSLKRRQKILRTLSIACEARGTDATGIAYMTDHKLHIQKAPRPARRMKFCIPSEARFVMGHTRMTTQGDAKHNYNNHPFPGRIGNHPFALAHNGVLHNDKELRTKHHLPKSKIETDSYVAVQLLEHENALNYESLATMAEALRGSFTITVLDADNNLYIVKGNNPMCIYQFEEEGLYLYASTQEILQSAVERLNLTQLPHRAVSVQSGQILRVAADGTLGLGDFNDDALWFSMNRDPLWHRSCFSLIEDVEEETEELLDLYAQQSGYDREHFQLLLHHGFDWMDLEQLIYDPELMDECMADILCGSSCFP